MIFDSDMYKLYSRYLPTDTKNEHYFHGVSWDTNNCSNEEPTKYEDTFTMFSVGIGTIELIIEGSFDEPPFYEPYEFAIEYTRPRLVYPKRIKKVDNI